MNIDLTPEQEQIINKELKSGHFRSVEELIAEALIALQEKARTVVSPGNDNSQSEVVREMLDFAEKNHTSLQGISIKQLIHEGHRL